MPSIAAYLIYISIAIGYATAHNLIDTNIGGKWFGSSPQASGVSSASTSRVGQGGPNAVSDDFVQIRRSRDPGRGKRAALEHATNLEVKRGSAWDNHLDSFPEGHASTSTRRGVCASCLRRDDGTIDDGPQRGSNWDGIMPVRRDAAPGGGELDPHAEHSPSQMSRASMVEYAKRNSPEDMEKANKRNDGPTSDMERANQTPAIDSVKASVSADENEVHWSRRQLSERETDDG
ncbi:Hypothetical protein D9617_4g003380 [Elsinoe fawcettii]|nr:Hypothetical protein D9617_4g003380 [Elsinoe fawcettii]